MTRFLAAACLVVFLFPSLFAQDPPLSQEQIQALMRQAADKDLHNQKHLRDYTYMQREVVHQLDSDGRTKSTETHTYETMILYDEPVQKQVAKDDKPLPEKDARKEDEKIQKTIDKLKQESEEDHRKRVEKADREREESRQFVREIPDAYNFHWVGVENFNGRETYVIDADPRSEYEPRIKNAKFLPKFRFRAWIDKAEAQWVKLDIQCIDTASVGLFVVRVHKGSNIQIELMRVNDEIWLPKHVALKLDARVALFKGLNFTQDLAFSDYKKFQTNIKILPLGEAGENH